MTSTVRCIPKSLGVLTAASLLLVGCSANQPAEVSQLTIVTTTSVLDQVSSLAVSEYVQEQGMTVEIQDHRDPEAVFESLDTQTADDHALVGVVTAHQDPEVEEVELLLPGNLDIISQAPAEFGLAATASTITAAQFVRDRDEPTEDDAALPLDGVCDDLTWIHAETPDDDVEAVEADLTEQGCEPTFETTAVVDADAYDDIVDRLKTQPDTVAMLYSLDPVIADQGLTTVDLEGDEWSRSNMVAVAPDDLDEPLVQDISAVLDAMDSESVTELLRGYHDARNSTSDLEYDVDNAIRYWLAEHDLVESETVTTISPDT